MPWHDENPWRRRHRREPETPEQRLHEIEKTCRAGDISLGDAIRAAYAVGQAYQQVRQEPASTTKE